MPRILARDLRPWLWTALGFTVLAIGVQFLPLARELHYEFAALAALWTSVGAGLATVVMGWRAQEASAPGDFTTRALEASAPGDFTTRALGAAIVATAPALAVSLVRNLLAGACGLAEGLLWYLLLVPASALVAVAVARLAAAITTRRWLQVVLFLALWGASMARGAFEALTGPHIYLYAWQIGFFPGGSWDPELPITPLLLLYRAGHVLIAAMLLLVLAEIERMRSGERRRGAALALPAALLAAIVLALLPLRSQIGLTRTDAWLRATLGDSVRTRYTTIYYDASTTDSLDIWRAANYADFYVWRHSRALGIGARPWDPIIFYDFSSGAEQKRLVGTSSASFTKPWRRTLNLSFDRVEPTLEHELAHIVLAPYGNLLGVSWSNGILEGSAVALEHADDAMLLHRHARAAYDFGLAPPVARVMSATGFASQRAALSYSLAGSFCRWLLDTYGARRFLHAYASGSLEEHYGRSVATLETEYQRFLRSLPPTDPRLEPTVRYLYGGGSFFLQRCLRRLATLTAEGYRALAEERYDDALERFRASLDEGVTAGARAGIIRTLHDSGRYDELIDSMEVYLFRDSLGAQLLPYQVELADAFSAVGPARGDAGSRYRYLDDVLRTGGDEWTRARAALRLSLSPLAAAMGIATDSVALAMDEYFRRPMSTAARISLLGELESAAPGGRDVASGSLLHLLRCNLQSHATPVLAARSATARAALDEAMVDSLSMLWHFSTTPLGSMPRPQTELGSETVGFAESALLRTLNDPLAMSIWSDGIITADERRSALAWIEAAYRYPSPMPRAAWPGELVLADRPRATFAAFLQYLDWHRPIATPRARR